MPETKPNLRAEIYEELQSEFETKIRELRRQKQLAEQELEDSSDKWRAERRRLNAEIERLETALIQVREELRKKCEAPPTPAPAPDTAEVERIQAAADEKIARFQEEWSTERTQLKAEVVRLQNAVVEALERSSNPMRSQQNLKNQYEAQLLQLRSEKNQLEQTYLRSKSEWEGEREKLQKEISQAPQTGRLSPQAKEDLKKQITARLRGDKSQPETPTPAPPPPSTPPPAWEAERQKLQADIQRLDASVDQARVEGKRTGFEEARKLFEPKFEEAARNQTKYEERIHTLETQLADDTAKLRDRVQELELELKQSNGNKGTAEKLKSLETRVQELQEENARIQQQLETSEESWNEERSSLLAELRALESRLERASAATKPQGSAEDRLRTLESELNSALSDLATAEDAIRSSSQGWRDEKQTLESQIQELRAALDQGIAGTSDLRQLQVDAESQMARADQLQMELTSERQSWSLERERLSEEFTRVEKELLAASGSWHAERSELESRIAALRTALDGVEAQRQSLHADTEARLVALDSERNKIEKEYQQASESWSTERARLLEEIAQLRGALEASNGSADSEKVYLQERIRSLEEALEKARVDSDASLASALRDMDSLEQRRLATEREYQAAAADWDGERARHQAQQSALTGEVDQLRHNLVTIQGELDERVPRSQLIASQAEVEAIQKRERESEAQHTAHLQERDVRISELTSQVHTLEESLENTRRVLHADTDQLKQSYDEKLQELTAQRSQLERDLAHAAMIERQFADARELWMSEEERFNHHCAELQQQLQESLQGAESQSHRHQAEAHQWNDERHGLREQVAQLEQSLSDAQRLQNQFQAQFEEASERWAEERRRLEGEIAQLQTRIEETQKTADVLLEDAARQASAQYEEIKASETAARTELEQAFESRLKVAREQITLSQQSTQTLEAERDHLRQVAAEAAASLAAFQSEVTALQQRVQELTHELLESQEAARNQQEKLKTSHEAELRRLADEHERLKREAETSLEGLLVEAEQQWKRDRQELEARADQLESALKESGSQIRPEALAALKAEYEQKLAQASNDHAALAARMNEMTSAFAEERVKLQIQMSGRTDAADQDRTAAAGTVGSEAVEAELLRIEQRITEIAALIDDPSTELATVIRKNVEKSEYDAYLRGIRFSLGRGPSLQKS